MDEFLSQFTWNEAGAVDNEDCPAESHIDQCTCNLELELKGSQVIHSFVEPLLIYLTFNVCSFLR